MGSLLPSMREKKRYVLVKWVGKKGDAAKAFGEWFGKSAVVLSGIKKIEEEDGYEVYRIKVKYLDKFRAALALSDFGESVPVVSVVSGTLKRLRKKAGFDKRRG